MVSLVWLGEDLVDGLKNLFYLICISNIRKRRSASGEDCGQQKDYFSALFVQLHAFIILFNRPNMYSLHEVL